MTAWPPAGTRSPGTAAAPTASPVAPGVYLARVRSGERAVTTRFVRMR